MNINRKYFTSLLLVLGFTAVILLYAVTSAEADTTGPVAPTFTVSEPVSPVLSPPLRDIVIPAPEPELAREANPIRWLGDGVGDEGRNIGLDPLVSLGVNSGDTPEPLVTFEGVPSLSGVTPPDTNGDVGPNHYIQMTNFHFQIWDKGDPENAIPPSPLTAPIALGTFFAPVGGGCGSNFGDPVVVYDDMADRWLLTQFDLSGALGMCMAVSTTPDPLGTYFMYNISTPDFPDYPKFGVWPDAYYMTTNTGFPGEYYVHAFDRVKMLAGLPATRQSFGNLPNLTLPADVDGTDAPPAGDPGIFYTFFHPDATGHPPGDERLAIYEFDVDWVIPGNTTFTLVEELPLAPFNYTICGFFAGGCIPQPGTGQDLDDIAWWPMYRFQYRNFGSYAAMVGNFTVDADGANHAGIRWFEVRNTGGTYTLFQEGTHFPDTNSRWMGSIAMDVNGNIALGYSISSTTVEPGIRYATRLAGDTPGTLSAEEEMFPGGGHQTGIHRWGDYSAMVVDPVDGCTFWFTSEYHNVNDSGFGWNTRIGVFQLDDCGEVSQEPEIDVDPNQITATQPTNTSQDVELTINNLGTDPLTWDIDEDNSPDAPSFKPPEGVTEGTGSGLLGLAEAGVIVPAGVQPYSYDGGSAVILDQAPNQVNGLFSDETCPLCGTGQQSIADNFVLGEDVTVEEIVFWGGYFPTNTPAADDITVIIHNDAGGVPGSVVYSESAVSTARVSTGVILFGVNEYIFTLTLATPVDLSPGAYYVEIFNNVAPDNFFWETGNTDTVGNGAAGSSFAFETPGVAWNFDGVTNLAVQLIGTIGGGGGGSCDAPEDIPWLSLDPTSGTTPGGDSDVVTVTLDSTGLADGEYNAALCVNSNDSNESLVVVPVTLNVETLAEIDIDPTSISNTQPTNSVEVVPLSISNVGEADLTWAIDEDTATVPIAGGWSDNFDSYPTDADLHGLGGWKGWGNDPTFTAFTTDDQALSSPNSVDINGASDLVQEYSGYTAGKWVYTAQMYIPSSVVGNTYFILLNTYDDSLASNNWSTQVCFNPTTDELYDDVAVTCNSGPSLSIVYDQWVEIRVEIDLDNDIQAFYYDNQLLYTDTWTGHVSGGGALNIGAVDLFANFATSVYWDDISLELAAPPVCASPDDIPWLDVNPDAGTTGPGDTTVVDVEFDSTGLADGTYTASLCLTSNDPDEGLIVVPVELTVEEAANYPLYLPLIKRDG